MVSCKFIVLVHERHHFVKDETKGKMSHTENKIISMLKSLLITHLSSSEDTFQQIIGTQMETKCAPLLADPFTHMRQRFYKDSPKTVKLQKLKHLISHSGIFMMYLRLIKKLLIGWISFTYNKELEIKEIVSADSFAHLFTVTSNLTQMVNCLPDFMTKETKL
jgi:hypothetical protein